MKLKNIPAPIWYLGGAALGIGALYLYFKKHGGIAGTASSAASAAVGAIGDAATGSVLGIGDAFGVPRTDQTACQKAIAAGDTWSASFACDASTFLSYVFGGSSGECKDCASKNNGSVAYDYGQGGSSGIPYAPGANPTPDVFNLVNYNWLQ